MSTLISQLGEEKAALSPGQLRLVNPTGPVTVPIEQVGGLGIAFDPPRPVIRSTHSFRDALPGIRSGESVQLRQRDQTSSETRQSRRVSFAGYDFRTPTPPEAIITSEHSSIIADPVISSDTMWQHDTKEAPPPYHPAHKRARSGSP